MANPIVECEICGKELKSQGIGGHMYSQHNIRRGPKAMVEELQERVDVLEGAMKAPPKLPDYGSRFTSLDVSLRDVQRRTAELELAFRSLRGTTKALKRKMDGGKPSSVQGRPPRAKKRPVKLKSYLK